MSLYCIWFHCIVLHVISLNCMLLHGFVFYSISLHSIACHFIVLYGIAWYCIVFGFFARHRTVMYRCYSAPANYRVVHLVIFKIEEREQSAHLCLCQVMQVAVNPAQEDKHMARVHAGEKTLLNHQGFSKQNQNSPVNIMSDTCWQGCQGWRRGRTSFVPLMRPLVSSIHFPSWNLGYRHHLDPILPILHKQPPPPPLDRSDGWPPSLDLRPQNSRTSGLFSGHGHSTSWSGNPRI